MIEQVNEKLIITEKEDTKKNQNELRRLFLSQFSIEDQQKFKIIKYKRNKIVCLENNDLKTYFLLRNVTYLGKPHQKYKKRIQIPTWYKEFSTDVEGSNCIFKFWGIYSTEKGFINVDFELEDYMERTINNSSAHVFVNDLYLGFKNGIFKKIDNNNNNITIIRTDKIYKYLFDDVGNTNLNAEIEFLEKFNSEFMENEWTEAMNAISEMHNDTFPHWRQAEWPGWYLEYKFSDFINKNYTSKKMFEYIDRDSAFELDFDLWVVERKHYGDLKSSSKSYSEILLNDKISIESAIKKHGKVWYLIYEHETCLDKDIGPDFIATRSRNYYIQENSSNGEARNPLSYKDRMKNKVLFTNMKLLEINEYNKRYLLEEFNQGKQQNGNSRKVKFKIKKKYMDNFILYSYHVNK